RGAASTRAGYARCTPKRLLCCGVQIQPKLRGRARVLLPQHTLTLKQGVCAPQAKWPQGERESPWGQATFPTWGHRTLGGHQQGYARPPEKFLTWGDFSPL